MVPFSGRSVPIVAGLALVLLGATASPSQAQASIGFTGGASIDPDQGYVGVFWQSPDFGGGFRIRPGLDGGFGDGVRMGTINFDFIYGFQLGQGPWSLVTGGGPTIVIWRYTDDFYDFGTDLTAGASYLFGFGHENGFFTEFRLGSGNVPLLKVGAGWMIRMR
jgi:hypothetical protein